MDSKGTKASKSKKEVAEPKPFVLKPKKPTSPWIYFNNEILSKLK